MVTLPAYAVCVGAVQTAIVLCQDEQCGAGWQGRSCDIH